MLAPVSAATARVIRGFFAEAGYTFEHFRANPELREQPFGIAGSLAYQLEGTRESTPLDTLLRWFFIGMPQESGRIPPAVETALIEAGLLRVEGQSLVPTAMLTPCGDYLFAADLQSRMLSAESADLVSWPNATSHLLELLALPTPAGSTLDFGCGCGMQGIMASARSGRVVCIDLNARATACTRFNASLNLAENVECLTGDAFEPVRGRTFDLILANPPFFITPSSDQMYCENSLDLDQFCQRVVREAPAHLNPGGWLQMVFEWVEVEGENWQERLTGWLRETGCDTWILRGYSRSAVAYARERIARLPPSNADRFTEWMDYYRARRVREIHGGILSMRKRDATGPNWIRIGDMPVDPVDPFGDSVLALFATMDALADDAALLRLKPKLAPGVRWSRQYQSAAGQWKQSSSVLKSSAGVPASIRADAAVAGFLPRCDGSHTLGDLAAGIAAEYHIDVAAAEAQCCAVIRKLAGERLVHF